MQKKLTQEQLDKLTIEANEFMESSGRKKFPPAKVEELRELNAKRCPKCATVKLTDGFPKDSSRRDGLGSKCRACDNANTADYLKRNTDKVMERHREYLRTRYRTDEHHRLRKQLDRGYRRAVQADNQADWVTPEQLLIWWQAKGIPALTCYLTGESLTPQTRSIDHVQAIGNGGPHTVDNLMPCTFEANQRKRDLSPDDAKEKLNLD